MKKAIIAAAALAILLFVVGIVLPWFINWDEHARIMVTTVKESSGYDVTYSRVSGEMLPTPALEVHDIVVGNPESPVLKAPLAKVKFSWGGVFSGASIPDEIEFLVPDVRLADSATTGNMVKISVPLTLQQAKIFYGGSKTPDLSQANITIKSGKQGGVASAGWAADGGNVKINLSWDSWPYDSPANISGDFDDGASKCSISGKALADENKALTGQAKIQCQTSSWATTLERVSPSWKDYDTKNLTPQAGTISADAEWKNGNFTLKNAQIAAGEDRLKADILIGEAQSAVAVDAESIVIDPYIASAERIFEILKKRRAAELAASPEQKLGIADERVIPVDVKAVITAKAAKLQWRGQWLEGLGLEADLENGVWTIPNATGSMPGGGNFTMSGNIGQYQQNYIFNGKIEASGNNMKTVLDWLHAPLPQLPDGTLGNYQISTSFAIAPEFWRLTETNMRVDDVAARGAMIVKLPPPKKVEGATELPDIRPEKVREKERRLENKDGNKDKKDDTEKAPDMREPEVTIQQQPPEVELSLAASGLDVDKYFPPESFMPKASDEVGQMVKRLDWLKNLGGKARIAIALSKAHFRGIDVAEFRGDTSLEPGKLDMTMFRVSQPDKEISGKFTLTPGVLHPGLDITLYSGPMAAEEVMGFIYGQPYTSPPRSTSSDGTKWPDSPIDLSLLNIADGVFDLNMDEFKLDGTIYSNVRFKGELRDSILQAEQLSAKLSLGEMALRGKLSGGNLPVLEASFVMGGVDIDKLLGIMLDVKSITGKTRISGSIKTSGINERSMIANMNGDGTIDIDNLVINGFDLNAISRRSLAARTVDDVSALGQISLTEGTSHVKTLAAHYAFKDGLMQFPVTSLETEYTSGGLQMTVDMLHFLMNMKLSFKPRTVTDATVPPLYLLVQGEVENPQRKLDIADLQAYIAKRAVGQ